MDERKTVTEMIEKITFWLESTFWRGSEGTDSKGIMLERNKANCCSNCLSEVEYTEWRGSEEKRHTSKTPMIEEVDWRGNLQQTSVSSSMVVLYGNKKGVFIFKSVVTPQES